MDLRRAASYFADTWLDGYANGVWVPRIACVTFLPHDRFISEREFGNKRRNFLIDPAETTFDTYPVVRLSSYPGEVYMVMRPNLDVLSGSIYSRVITMHRAYHRGSIIAMEKQVSASGVSAQTIPRAVGTYHCDVQNVTFSTSREAPTVRWPDSIVIFPRGVPVNTTNEIRIGTLNYEVQEIYESSGLLYCRSLVKPASSSVNPFARPWRGRTWRDMGTWSGAPTEEVLP